MHGTHYIGSNGVAGRRLGNTEIRNLYLSFLGNDNVLGLDIPVNDVIVVSRFNTHTYLDGNAHGFFIG